MIAKTRRDAIQQAAIIERRRAFIERWAQPRIKRTIRSMADTMAEEYKNGGMERIDAQLDVPRAEMQAELVMVYDRTGKSMQAVAKQSSKAFCDVVETKDDVTDEDLGEAFDIYMDQMAVAAFESSKSITETMADEIRAMITGDDELVRRGPLEVARAIRKQYEGMSVWKSQMISRTEVVTASSTAQEEMTNAIWNEEEEGPLYKEWIPGRDSRTRDQHRKMRGEVVPFKDTFTLPNGDRMKFPGDRSGKPENYIHCRCSYASLPVELVPPSKR